jgi:hypothetical protein
MVANGDYPHLFAVGTRPALQARLGELSIAHGCVRYEAFRTLPTRHRDLYSSIAPEPQEISNEVG